MQSKVMQHPTPGPKYPILMKNIRNNVIVLMKAHKTGIVINCGSSSWKIGEYSQDWDMEYFVPLPASQTVVLSNE